MVEAGLVLKAVSILKMCPLLGGSVNKGITVLCSSYAAPVWKVARYTSAAPIFFTEFEGYVDGGVLANNPCEYGLTAIQRFHREHQVNLPIAMVVSVGTGIYPPEELGSINAQEFLFFGKHWFNFSDNVKKRAKNLLALLTNAVSSWL